MIRFRPMHQRRPHLAILAGLLALFLQVLAPTLPPAAMANAMDLVAATPEEAASFAATCLGLGRPDLEQQAPADHQAKCPICFSVAQGQGFVPQPATLVTAIAWAETQPVFGTEIAHAVIAASAFASRAPPAA
jgi:hypothetical protein